MYEPDRNREPEEPPPVRLSVQQQGRYEALRHKWIESEKAGRDLGEWAIQCWVREHWNGFLRAKWLEHLQGKAFWIELDHDDYGLLQHQFKDSKLIDRILKMLVEGKENLGVLNWAIDEGIPKNQVVEILLILEVLDINSRRIQCEFAGRLSSQAI